MPTSSRTNLSSSQGALPAYCLGPLATPSSGSVVWLWLYSFWLEIREIKDKVKASFHLLTKKAMKKGKSMEKEEHTREDILYFVLVDRSVNSVRCPLSIYAHKTEDQLWSRVDNQGLFSVHMDDS
jgi:hypothetical protein